MRRTNHKNGGFTIIEMMVVVSIVVILLAVGFPTLWKLERESRVSQGSNALSVSTSATRALATRGKANLTTVPQATYSGTACIVAPNQEIRITENHQGAQNGGNYLEPAFNGYVDIPGRDYVGFPEGVNIAGIYRDVAGNAKLLAPPFAIRFDRNGKLVAGLADDKRVIYDANYNGSWDTSSTRPGSYNPIGWDANPEDEHFNQSAGKYEWRFENIETVIGAVVFNQFALNDLAVDDGNPDNDMQNGRGGAGDFHANAKDWIFKHGKVNIFSRQTGVVVRDKTYE